MAAAPTASPTGSWETRFTRGRSLGVRGPIELVSVVEKARGTARVIALAAGDAPVETARDALAEMARVLDLLSHPVIPSVDEACLDQDTPGLVLSSGAVLEFPTVCAMHTARDRRIPYAVAMGLAVVLGDAISHAHTVVDPRTGRSPLLGSLAAADLAVGADGALSFFGYGHMPASLEDAAVAATTGRFTAPAATRGPATRGSDVVAGVMLLRSLAQHVELPAGLRSAYAGLAAGRGPLGAAVEWVNRLVVAGGDDVRMDDAMRVYRGVWRALGITPDLDGFRAICRDAVAWHRGEPEGGPPGAVRVSRDASTVHPSLGQAPIDLSRRGGARHVLRALLRARLASPGAWVSVDAIVAQAWPGERVIREAGANRVYVAVSDLRNLGLRDLIERGRAGYRLVPEVAIAIDDGAPTGRESDPDGWLPPTPR